MMTFEDKLKSYKKNVQIPSREEAIQRTIKMSKEAFWESEQEGILSYYEFLWMQWKVIQKRWWILQFLLLCMSGILLISAYENRYIQRSMGVMASLFVILIIPELWKNRTYQCMEIEEASYYSLRQIYAARMAVFGTVDVLFLTVFCGIMTMGLHVELKELLIQFLFPLCVTACICFGALCSKYHFSEAMAIVMCIIWSTIWLFMILNESIYEMITFPIWLFLLGIALAFLAFAVYRTLESCNKYWEVPFDGIEV